MRTITSNHLLAFSVAICIGLLLAPFDNSYFKSKPLHYPQYEDPGPVIGIDLGLKYSRVGILQNDRFEMISDENGRDFVPSIVSFTSDGKQLVGFEAQEYALKNPKNTIYDIRRLIGGNFSDPAIQKEISSLPYDVVERSIGNGSLEIRVRTSNGERLVSTEEVTAMILKHLKAMAETHLNTTIKSAVIAVPPYFSETQRRATEMAADISGLDVLRIIDEQNAAAYGHRIDLWQDCRQSDFYMSEDCNILVYDIHETESDLTYLISDRGILDVGASVHTDRGWRLLRHLPAMIQSPLKHLGIGHSAELIESVERILADVKLSKQDIHAILVTGDPALIPDGQKALEGYLKNAKAIANPGFTNDEAIVRGAAYVGDAQRSWSFEWDGPCTMFDVTYLSMGIEANNGIFHTIVHENTVIPTRKYINVSTTSDDQEKVFIKVWEGQRKIANKNRFLGTLELAGLSPMPKGVPNIEISLEIDENIHLSAMAREFGSEHENRVQFIMQPRRSNYTPEIIQAIFEDAEKFRDEDALLAEKLSNIDSHQSEDNRGDFGILVR